MYIPFFLMCIFYFLFNVYFIILSADENSNNYGYTYVNL